MISIKQYRSLLLICFFASTLIFMLFAKQMNQYLAQKQHEKIENTKN